jgi:LacI family transcriptional regulator
MTHGRALALDMDPALIVFAAAFNEDEGAASAEELIRRRTVFTAIVCANDRLAIGAIAALRRHGLDCPSDVSVTGYNDMPLVDRLSPALTTVRIQQYGVGFDAAHLLLEMIEMPANQRQPRHLIRPVNLVVRDSTGLPRKTSKKRVKRRSA